MLFRRAQLYLKGIFKPNIQTEISPSMLKNSTAASSARKAQVFEWNSGRKTTRLLEKYIFFGTYRYLGTYREKIKIG